MIKAGKNRTWMRVKNTSYVFWVAVEHDTIVATQPPGMRFDSHKELTGHRADDALSILARNWTVEGPFDEPQ